MNGIYIAVMWPYILLSAITFASAVWAIIFLASLHSRQTKGGDSDE